MQKHRKGRAVFFFTSKPSRKKKFSKIEPSTSMMAAAWVSSPIGSTILQGGGTASDTAAEYWCVEWA